MSSPNKELFIYAVNTWKEINIGNHIVSRKLFMIISPNERLIPTMCHYPTSFPLPNFSLILNEHHKFTFPFMVQLSIIFVFQTRNKINYFQVYIVWNRIESKWEGIQAFSSFENSIWLSISQIGRSLARLLPYFSVSFEFGLLT